MWRSSHRRAAPAQRPDIPRNVQALERDPASHLPWAARSSTRAAWQTRRGARPRRERGQASAKRNLRTICSKSSLVTWQLQVLEGEKAKTTAEACAQHSETRMERSNCFASKPVALRVPHAWQVRGCTFQPNLCKSVKRRGSELEVDTQHLTSQVCVRRE